MGERGEIAIVFVVVGDGDRVEVRRESKEMRGSPGFWGNSERFEKQKNFPQRKLGVVKCWNNPFASDRCLWNCQCLYQASASWIRILVTSHGAVPRPQPHPIVVKVLQITGFRDCQVVVTGNPNLNINLKTALKHALEKLDCTLYQLYSKFSFLSVGTVV